MSPDSISESCFLIKASGSNLCPVWYSGFYVSYHGYHLNKQLHALSSALYQKIATFTVLLSFCFFCEV